MFSMSKNSRVQFMIQLLPLIDLFKSRLSIAAVSFESIGLSVPYQPSLPCSSTCLPYNLQVAGHQWACIAGSFATDSLTSFAPWTEYRLVSWTAIVFSAGGSERSSIGLASDCCRLNWWVGQSLGWLPSEDRSWSSCSPPFFCSLSDSWLSPEKELKHYRWCWSTGRTESLVVVAAIRQKSVGLACFLRSWDVQYTPDRGEAVRDCSWGDHT